MIERKAGERVKFNTPGHEDHGKSATVVKVASQRKGRWATYVVRDEGGIEQVVGDWEIVGEDIQLEATQ